MYINQTSPLPLSLFLKLFFVPISKSCTHHANLCFIKCFARSQILILYLKWKRNEQNISQKKPYQDYLENSAILFHFFSLEQWAACFLGFVLSKCYENLLKHLVLFQNLKARPGEFSALYPFGSLKKAKKIRFFLDVNKKKKGIIKKQNSLSISLFKLFEIFSRDLA